jgi:hypothetical protein|tara:strand:+ start:644 stop:766 length:123 start_codon:yes stop_codon:yes gene_type:complete
MSYGEAIGSIVGAGITLKVADEFLVKPLTKKKKRTRRRKK